MALSIELTAMMTSASNPDMVNRTLPQWEFLSEAFRWMKTKTPVSKATMSTMSSKAIRSSYFLRVVCPHSCNRANQLKYLEK